MGGFGQGLLELLGGFNAQRRIDKEGFDWREKAKQAEAARQQEQQKWGQENEDWATKAATEADLGAAPGEDISSVVPGYVNKQSVLARARGAGLQAKSSLKAQDVEGRRLQAEANVRAATKLQDDRQAAAMEVVDKLELQRRTRPLSPGDEARLTAAKQIATGHDAARRSSGGAPIKMDFYDENTGETTQSFITREQAQRMAEQNSGAGSAGFEPSGIAKAPGATVANRRDAARQSIEVGSDILQDLADPETMAVLGPAIGRYKSIEAAAGAGDPVAVKLRGKLMGFSALQMAIHNARNYKIAEDVKGLLTAEQTPEALQAGLMGILGASRAIAHQPLGSGGGMATPRSEAEFRALPSGTRFKAPDGTIRVKP